MKIRYVLSIFSLVFLCQSCEHKITEIKEEPTIKEPKINEAASYNTRLGLAYLQQGNRSLAKRKLLLALSQDPDSADVNASMAYFMEKSGDMDKATIFYQKAMALAPGAGAQFNNYGAFLCRRGHYKEAEKYFMKAVKDVAYDHTAGAYENAGLCLMAASDDATASAYFMKALEQDPSRQQSLYELVTLNMKEGKMKEAYHHLKKHSNLCQNDRALLQLAIKVANQSGHFVQEEDYKKRLKALSENTGEHNEYNTSNG